MLLFVVIIADCVPKRKLLPRYPDSLVTKYRLKIKGLQRLNFWLCSTGFKKVKLQTILLKKNQRVCVIDTIQIQNSLQYALPYICLVMQQESLLVSTGNWHRPFLCCITTHRNENISNNLFTYFVIFSKLRCYHFLWKGVSQIYKKSASIKLQPRYFGINNFMTPPPLIHLTLPLNRLKLYWNQSFWTK